MRIKNEKEVKAERLSTNSNISPENKKIVDNIIDTFAKRINDASDRLSTDLQKIEFEKRKDIVLEVGRQIQNVLRTHFPNNRELEKVLSTHQEEPAYNKTLARAAKILDNANIIVSNDLKIRKKDLKDAIRTLAVALKLRKNGEDNEVDMAISELRAAEHHIKNLIEIFNKLDSYANLPAWTQSKITKAEDYLNSVCKYFSGIQKVDEKDVAESSLAPLEAANKNVLNLLQNEHRAAEKELLGDEAEKYKKQLKDGMLAWTEFFREIKNVDSDLKAENVIKEFKTKWDRKNWDTLIKETVNKSFDTVITENGYRNLAKKYWH